jgi:hypothetical protein
MSSRQQHAPNHQHKRRSFTSDGSELTAALRCANLGLAVVPMHTVRGKRCTCPQTLKDLGRCKPGKHPIIKAGYPGASNDPHKIMNWWGVQWPWANVGLRTGPDHVAFDPDSRSGGDLVLQELIHQFGPLPETWECISGSGDARYIYRLPEGISLRTGTVRRDGRSLDVIADTGGLIVAGVHNSGNPYTNVWRDVALLPEAWYEGLLSEGLSASPLTYLDTIGGGITYDLALADQESLANLRWAWRLTGKAFPDEDGAYVLCPSHREDTPSAIVYVSLNTGRAKYHCFAGCGSQGAADLFAYIKFNVLLGTLGSPTKDAKGVRLALFEQRMKIHRGAVPRSIERLPRPEEMSDLVWAVEGDFHELLECKAAKFKGKPTGYSLDFGAFWGNRPKGDVKKAWSELGRLGRIRVVGEGTLYGRSYKLYLPGDGVSPAQQQAQEVEEWFNQLVSWPWEYETDRLFWWDDFLEAVQTLSGLITARKALPAHCGETQPDENTAFVRETSEQRCLCGCGSILGGTKRKKYLNSGHEKRAKRNQKKGLSANVSEGKTHG